MPADTATTEEELELEEPVLETPEEEVVETPVEGEEETEVVDLREQYGLTDLPESDEELYSHIAELRKKAQQAEHSSAWQQLAMQRDAEIRQLQRSQQAEQERAQQWQAWQQQQAQAAQQPKWEAPEYDPQWQTMLMVDDAGNIVAKPGAMPDLPQKYMAYQKFQQDKQREFFANPQQFIHQQYGTYVQQTAAQMAQQIVQQQMAQYEERQFTHQFVDTHKDWLVEKDSTGQLVYENGKPKFNPLGLAFDQKVSELRQSMGMGLRQATDIALAFFERDAYASQHGQQAAQQTVAQQNADKKRQLLRGGAQTNRTGAASKPGKKVPQKITSEADFRAALEQRLAHLPPEEIGIRDPRD